MAVQPESSAVHGPVLCHTLFHSVDETATGEEVLKGLEDLMQTIMSKAIGMQLGCDPLC